MSTHFSESSTDGGVQMFAHKRGFAPVVAGLVTAMIAVLLESGYAAAWTAQLVSAS
jgi:hypothetical protein